MREINSSKGTLDSLHQHLGFKRGLTIASLNVKRLRSHDDDIQLLLRDHDIHIIATYGTKFDPSYSTQLTRINVRIERPMEEVLQPILRIPLGTSYERIFLIVTLN